MTLTAYAIFATLLALFTLALVIGNRSDKRLIKVRSDDAAKQRREIEMRRRLEQ